ncbi:MAG TPA: LuxR C-terminal-related transcriptional regulator [Solirubrobacteraceae bacterium]|nr:LuxR C-terminal-related transcriptional regulator [Solirubrobacteraceae bacterium]
MADAPAAVKHAGSAERAWLIPRPGLFELLGTAERVVLVSAPAGSGKTFLLRSWIAAEGLDDRAAWVSVRREERDAQAFWLSVLDSLRQTRVGSARVRELTAAPDLDAATVVRRLLEDLGSLDEPLWLVIDDAHELQAEEAPQQVELLLANAPPALRLVLLTRRDLRLGLHRLRLEGELSEIRGEDLRFSMGDSRRLLEAAGVRVSDGAVESLVASTEGWAAGLRLAALSMARDPDPERLAARFSGRERGVADYLLAEVLERQPPAVSRLLLRTSILERVSGPLADRLTGCSGSEGILWELEDAGAFVVSLDAERSWFRYHHLFADLLALELRRTVPEELPGLHTIAAEWLAENGYPVEAIRHAQAAEDWGLATRLLADSWFGLELDGRRATARQLLSIFPAAMIRSEPELAVLSAAAERFGGSLDEAERYLGLAEAEASRVSGDRRDRFQLALAFTRLSLARIRVDLNTAGEAAQQLRAHIDATPAVAPGLRQGDLLAMTLTELGIASMWAGRFEEGQRHLDLALVQARSIGRPRLELLALAHRSIAGIFRVQRAGEEGAREAIELARKYGLEEDTAVAVAYIVLSTALVWRGRVEEAEHWLALGKRGLAQEANAAPGLILCACRQLLEFIRGRPAEAMTYIRAAERMEMSLVMPHRWTLRMRGARLRGLIRLGETDRVEQAFDEMDHDVRVAPEMRVVLAELRLAQDDPVGAAAAVAPIVDGALAVPAPIFGIQALLLEAIARDALRDPGAAFRALERALDLAEPGGLLFPFLLHPAPDLLARAARLRTTHAALISEILNLLSGRTPVPRPEDVEPLREPLSESELRVLRYLPTNLPAPEIAGELFVSLNTIRTHMRNMYAKLGVHSRADAVKRARELGLLSPSSLTR